MNYGTFDMRREQRRIENESTAAWWVMSVMALPFRAWGVMLCLGVIYSETGWGAPWGYWPCLALVFGVRTLLSGMTFRRLPDLAKV